MALVKRLEKLEKQRNTVHDEVESTYTIFTDSSGNKFLQIDTYGSTNRQFRGKVSQSIQLSKESAKELLNIISNQLLTLYRENHLVRWKEDAKMLDIEEVWARMIRHEVETLDRLEAENSPIR